MDNLTAQQRLDISYTFNDLFGICLLVQPDGSSTVTGNCTDLFDIVSYRFGYLACWNFNFKSKEFPLNFLYSNRADTVAGQLYFFAFSKLALNRSSESCISYNMNHEYNRMGYYRFIFLSELGNLISLSYEEYSNLLLPRPYVTNCRRYLSVHGRSPDKEGIVDRGSCTERNGRSGK